MAEGVTVSRSPRIGVAPRTYDVRSGRDRRDERGWREFEIRGFLNFKIRTSLSPFSPLALPFSPFPLVSLVSPREIFPRS